VSTTDQPTRTETNPQLAALLDHIVAHVPAARAAAIRSFATLTIHRLPEEALAGSSTEELFGRIMGVFDLADGRRDEIAVRALNPSLAGNGYRTAGSVVETNTDDSPFLFDSVSQEIQSRGLSPRQALHPVMGVERSPDRHIVRIAPATASSARESFIHIELDRHLTRDELTDLTAAIRSVLGEVRLAVRDFRAMRERTHRAIEVTRAATGLFSEDEVEETAAFLEWLLDDNYIFLGAREYERVGTPGGDALQVVDGSGLGILSDTSTSSYARPVLLSDIDPDLFRRFQEGLLMVSKTNRLSRVHRRARMDYIGVRRVGRDGGVGGEIRLLGLFTSKAYMQAAAETPLIRRKLRRFLEAEDLIRGSHDYKEAVSLFESFPKDELFAAPLDALSQQIEGLLRLQEQQHVAVFVRRDIASRSVSIVVALPRDLVSTSLRHRLQDLFMRRYNGIGAEYHLSLGETDPALIHFTVHVGPGDIPDVSFRELEEEVVALTRTWDDRLREQLIQLHGEERGRELADRWIPRFPDYYKSSTDVYLAVLDTESFQKLVDGGDSFVVSLQNERAQEENLTRLGLYRTGGKVRLSDFMPILEDLGLQVVEEVPTGLLGGDEQTYLHDFGVLGSDGEPLPLSACGDDVAACIAAVWRGQAVSDSLNRLVVTAGLTWQQVVILRAYRTYRQRVSAAFTEEYQNDTFAANPGIAAKLLRLFQLRFDPSTERDRDVEEALHHDVLEDLEAVRSLDADRILRGYLGLILATVRTNAFRPARTNLSFKIRSEEVPDMPKPYPLYEIFVYSPDMEAIHLRSGRVARGGIRWSDRLEDYRTEVLGLMKAQRVKNAVIVPTGSKGGFVLKRPPSGPAALKDEVKKQYVAFMRAMLDVTDNLVDGQVVQPDAVQVLDGDDPYLVVAADKGTATFSDTANAVSEEYGFWLGDAFASGGSAGYDHKRMGITARGAWESVKRHFREVGHDVMNEPFTVVGIGDMSGDVFGNGMLLSDHIRLVAAFDHRHVFIDPDPDPATTFQERRRLFELAGSSWDDFDRTKISRGGGVWARTEKSVHLSPEAMTALGMEPPEEPLTPSEVIRSILRAPVDLLWNGGIGTYVKASAESNADVGDRTNDPVRVDGRELRARVVGEGGNLGFTQRGRIEYALAGGGINTDFIDNSAGVDTSDHEVNLKILLGLAERRGDLTRKQRDQAIHAVADDVAAHVLEDNFLQAQILSQEAKVSPQRMEAYEDLMQSLEARALLERDIEALPSSEEMTLRRQGGRGLVRPELAVLLAYAKISLTGALVRSDMPDEPYFERDMRDYFPHPIVQRFGQLLPDHPLRRELIATIVANDIVNSMGITYVSRVVAESGAEPAEVAKAYRVARDVTGAAARWKAIETKVAELDPPVTDELMTGVDRLVEVTARWYLTNAAGADLTATVHAGREGFERLSDGMPEIGPDAWRADHERDVDRLIKKGVPEALARRHAFQLELVHAPDIIVVGQETGRAVEEVARAFFLVGDVLHIDALESRMDQVATPSRWHRWALQAIEDDLLLVRRQLAAQVIGSAGGRSIDDAVSLYLGARAQAVGRLDRFMRSLSAERSIDLAALTVAVRQVRALAG
jgi:glutamate dehydrogenase